MSTIDYFFAWPTGAIWGNLTASIILAIPTSIHIYRLHRRIDRMKKHMSWAEAIKDAVLAVEEPL